MIAAVEGPNFATMAMSATCSFSLFDPNPLMGAERMALQRSNMQQGMHDPAYLDEVKQLNPGVLRDGAAVVLLYKLTPVIC